MRDVREVRVKMNALEDRLEEFYHISDAFSGDGDDAEYEKGVLLEIDALESTIALLNSVNEVDKINKDVVQIMFDELRGRLERKRSVVENYDTRLDNEYLMGDEGNAEDADVKADMDWAREVVYVLESNVRMMRWLMKIGEEVT